MRQPKASWTFLILFSVLLWATALAGASITQPRAVNGLLDLSHWNFEQHGIVKLDGQWEFYWNELLEPTAFLRAEPPEPSGVVEVPSGWRSVTLLQNDDIAEDDAVSVSGNGSATYRLLVRVNESNPLAEGPAADGDYASPLAVFIPFANTSYRLWIDGQLAAANGRVGTRPDETDPQHVARLVRFTPKGELVEIVMQIANFHFREGGLSHSLELGLADHVAAKQRRVEMVDAFLIGVALFTSMFFLALYAERMEHRAAAYFSLFVLTMAIRIGFSGNYVVYRILPDIPWEWGLKVEYITGYLLPPLLFLYMRSLFPNELPKRVVQLVGTIGCLLTVVVLVTPGGISSQFIPAYLVVVIVYVVYATMTAVRAVWKKREDAWLFLAGCITYLASVVINSLGIVNVIRLVDVMPIGTAAFVVTQGWTVARQSARNVAQQRRLAKENAEMLARTRWQLAELQKYRRLMTVREEGLRRQIAEMLHGQAQGRLFAALTHIQRARAMLRKDPDEAARHLEDAKHWVVKVREEDIRDVSRRLHPTAVAAGLIPALESLVRVYEDSFRIDLHVDPAAAALDTPMVGGLSEELRLGIYRILEEALNNVIRHADARRVTVSIRLRTGAHGVPPAGDGDQLELIVVDDGKGFDPASLQYSLGLQTMDARVGDLGGTWEFSGAVGGGATLRVLVPVARPTMDPEETSTKTSSSHESGADPHRRPATWGSPAPHRQDWPTSS